MVGAPTAAVNPLSAQPPVNSPSAFSPLRAAASTYMSNSRFADGDCVSGRNSPLIVSSVLVPGTKLRSMMAPIAAMTSSRSAGAT